MKTRVFTLMIAGLLGLFLITGLSTPADAAYDDYADRLSREHRVANEVDEWIERGSATITASPLFDEGVRLTAWESSAQNAENYEFAIASAVYLFEIPRGAQSIDILVRYRGEPRQLEIEDYEEPIAGRVWIRNTKRELTRRGYHDKNAEETRYGDAFVLRAKNRSERIKIPAAGHVKDDGWNSMSSVKVVSSLTLNTLKCLPIAGSRRFASFNAICLPTGGGRGIGIPTSTFTMARFITRRTSMPITDGVIPSTNIAILPSVRLMGDISGGIALIIRVPITVAIRPITVMGITATRAHRRCISGGRS